MPKPSIRRRSAYTPPRRRVQTPVRAQVQRWVAPLMVGFLVLGLAWIVVFYLSGSYPVPPLHNWNILAGFGLIAIGFGLSTQWR